MSIPNTNTIIEQDCKNAAHFCAENEIKFESLEDAARWFPTNILIDKEVQQHDSR